MLQNEPTLVIVATHTAENEPSKVFSEINEMVGSTVAVSGVMEGRGEAGEAGEGEGRGGGRGGVRLVRDGRRLGG